MASQALPISYIRDLAHRIPSSHTMFAAILCRVPPTISQDLCLLVPALLLAAYLLAVLHLEASLNAFDINLAFGTTAKMLFAFRATSCKRGNLHQKARPSHQVRSMAQGRTAAECHFPSGKKLTLFFLTS